MNVGLRKVMQMGKAAIMCICLLAVSLSMASEEGLPDGNHNQQRLIDACAYAFQIQPTIKLMGELGFLDVGVMNRLQRNIERVEQQLEGGRIEDAILGFNSFHGHLETLRMLVESQFQGRQLAQILARVRIEALDRLQEIDHEVIRSGACPGNIDLWKRLDMCRSQCLTEERDIGVVGGRSPEVNVNLEERLEGACMQSCFTNVVAIGNMEACAVIRAEIMDSYVNASTSLKNAARQRIVTMDVLAQFNRSSGFLEIDRETREALKNLGIVREVDLNTARQLCRSRLELR